MLKRPSPSLVAVQFTTSLVSLWILGWLMQKDWFYSALGVQTHTTSMALLLFFIAAPAFSFLLQPIASLYSRKQEYEADAYAAGERYLPDDMPDVTFYEPTAHGLEARIRERLADLREHDAEAGGKRAPPAQEE